MENKSKLQALNTIVIVKEVTLENKTEFGFDLTGVVDANETQKKGIVKSIGELCPKLDDENYTLKLDDVVLFDKNKCTPITIDAVRYIMIDYRDLYIRL